jgi:hypothetical protein
MDAQMVALYQLAQQVGRADFLAALELAREQQTFGAEYVQALVTKRRSSLLPVASPSDVLARFGETVPQHLVERDLQLYEQYVANRAALGRLSVGGDG